MRMIGMLCFEFKKLKRKSFLDTTACNYYFCRYTGAYGKESI